MTADALEISQWKIGDIDLSKLHSLSYLGGNNYCLSIYTGELAYDRLDGTVKTGPSYAKSVMIYI